RLRSQIRESPDSPGRFSFLNEGLPYRVPYPQTTPVQESGPARPIPSGIC
ncbi:hypothetical protein, partial [Mycobacterium tuberculosis]